MKTCWRNHLGAFSWSVDIHVLMSQTTSFEQLLFPLSKEIFLTNETDNNKTFVHIKTWLVRLPCLKVHITLWLLKTLFLHHGALMNPNYSYQTPFKSQWKKKTQRRFRWKEAGAHRFYTWYWTCSLIIAASNLRSVQLDSHGDQHCPQKLHYIQIKMKRNQHSYKFPWKACQLLYFITQHFCFSN